MGPGSRRLGWASLVSTFVIVILAWAVARMVFFEGLWGLDDLFHADYVLHRDHLPRNHWETRLVYNGLLRASVDAFGFSETALALPGLLGSLLFVSATWWAASRAWGLAGGLAAGLVAATLPLDVVRSTTPAAMALASGVASVGTAVLFGRPTRGGVLARSGLCLGAAAVIHPVLLFFALVATAAFAITSAPGQRLAAALRLGGAAVLTYVAVTGTLNLWVSGDPLYEFRVIQTSHLDNQGFDDPVWLASGALNRVWVTGPIIEAVVSRTFGLTIAVALPVAWIRRREPGGVAFALVLMAGYWFWVSFGSQHPFKYRPLEHTTRYWYPIAIAVCFVIGAGVRRYGRTAAAATTGLIGLNVALLLILGPFGKNVEISGELREHALQHPASRFVTDRYTFNEMCVLGGGAAPPNVGLIGRPPTLCAPSPDHRNWPIDDVLVLVNPLQAWRPDFAPIRDAARDRRSVEVGVTELRTAARLLPTTITRNRPWAVRKPPGLVYDPR